jgi:hypothetical protein
VPADPALPPLIWGWLTYRVMAFDALADHASADERREVFRRHRMWLLGIGVLTGYLGAAPSIIWASGALFAAAFVILVPLAIWIYTLVFAFSSLWFAHYCLAALERLRAESAAVPAPPSSPRLGDNPEPAPLGLADDARFPGQMFPPVSSAMKYLAGADATPKVIELLGRWRPATVRYGRCPNDHCHLAACVRLVTSCFLRRMVPRRTTTHASAQVRWRGARIAPAGRAHP